jgi:hypothetical protein
MRSSSGSAAAGSSFLGGALKTAAGVAGGVMLAQGISSLFHHNQQPQEIVEVIKEEPAQVSDQSNNGWGDDQRMAGNDSYSNDQGGFTDADYNDDSSSFSAATTTLSSDPSVAPDLWRARSPQVSFQRCHSSTLPIPQVPFVRGVRMPRADYSRKLPQAGILGAFFGPGA